MIDLIQLSVEALGHAAQEAGHATAASANPVEQLASVFHVEWATLFAQMLSFGLIFLALRLFAWGPLVKTMEERRQKIADGLQYAEEMRSKLADAERKQSEVLKEAALEAKKMVSEAEKSARQLVEKTQLDAQRRAEEMIARTRESLSQEKQQMLAELRTHAAQLVALTASKVLSKELSTAEMTRYAERAAKEIAQ
jgi:F-type H+-transporting ATPase subunit b